MNHTIYLSGGVLEDALKRRELAHKVNLWMGKGTEQQHWSCFFSSGHSFLGNVSVLVLQNFLHHSQVTNSWRILVIRGTTLPQSDQTWGTWGEHWTGLVTLLYSVTKDMNGSSQNRNFCLSFHTDFLRKKKTKNVTITLWKERVGNGLRTVCSGLSLELLKAREQQAHAPRVWVKQSVHWLQNLSLHRDQWQPEMSHPTIARPGHFMITLNLTLTSGPLYRTSTNHNQITRYNGWVQGDELLQVHYRFLTCTLQYVLLVVKPHYLEHNSHQLPSTPCASPLKALRLPKYQRQMKNTRYARDSQRSHD